MSNRSQIWDGVKWVAMSSADFDGSDYLRLDGTSIPAQRHDIIIGGSGQPGIVFAAGDSITTPDINKALGDDANLHQSIGNWLAVENVGAPYLAQAVTPVFGDAHGAVVAGAAGTTCMAQCRDDSQVVDENGTYSIGVGVAAALDAQARIKVTYHTASNGWVGEVILTDYLDVDSSGFRRIVADDIEVLPGAERIRFRIEWRIAGGVFPQEGDTFYWDGYGIVDGPVAPASFISSMNVTGGDTIDPSGMVVDYAGYGDPLKVADGWAGTGYQFRRVDGPGGPLTVEWLATEAIDAINAGQSEYVGADGRTWTIVGNPAVDPGQDDVTSKAATLADIDSGGELIDHDDLLNVRSDQHHTRYTDTEARSAVTGIYLPLTGGTVTGDVTLLSEVLIPNLEAIEGPSEHAIVGWSFADGSLVILDSWNGPYLQLSGGTLTGQLLAVASGADEPGYGFADTSGMGLYRVGPGTIGLAVDGALRLQVTPSIWAGARLVAGEPLIRHSIAGSASQPIYSFNDDTETGMYRSSAGNLGFAANTKSVLRMTQTAFVAVAVDETTTTGAANVNVITGGQMRRSTAITAFVDEAEVDPLAARMGAGDSSRGFDIGAVLETLLDRIDALEARIATLEA